MSQSTKTPAARLPGWLVPALVVVLVVALLAGDAQLDALQKMAGYKNEKSLFGEVQSYLENLRDSLIPLAIPLGGIGLAGGAAAYIAGNVMAQKILFGAVTGAALAMMAPSIVA